MKIRFLGTGGAFDYNYGNSSATVDLGQRILIDCGPSVFPKLAELGITESIDFILLTHLHGDHVGALFQLIFFMRHHLKRTACFLTPSTSFATETRNLLRAQGVPDDYYTVRDLDTFEGVTAYDTTSLHSPGVTSFAYVFKWGGRVIYYSGDLGCVRRSEEILSAYDARSVTVFHEMHHLHSSAHVHYSDLGSLIERYKVYGYHCNPELIPDDCGVPLVWSNAEFLW